MQLDRIEDYIINGEGIDFNFYSQREFIPPSINDKIELGNYLLYVAIKFYNYDIHKELSLWEIIEKNLPVNFLKDSNSFEEAKIEINNFKSKLSRYKRYNFTRRENETYKDLFERFLFTLSADRSGIGAGYKFYSPVFTNEFHDSSHRLYIPCNSDYCYRFARLIIEKCIKYKLPFQFKIMNIEECKNGADNIVMYIMGENFSQYVNMINEIISENSDISFGRNHMFGYSVNRYISLTPELEGNSFSGHMRNLLKEGIFKYGRTSSCVKFVQDEVLDIYNDCGIIEAMNKINTQNVIKKR